SEGRRFQSGWPPDRGMCIAPLEAAEGSFQAPRRCARVPIDSEAKPPPDTKRSENTPDRALVRVGTKLQEARKPVRISLRQIADSTKVSINTLQALERNEFSRLPGGLFARGYVRSFAIEVGLDPEVTVAEFVEQSPVDSVRDGYVGPKGAGP